MVVFRGVHAVRACSDVLGTDSFPGEAQRAVREPFQYKSSAKKCITAVIVMLMLFLP